ncbi:hypothetical protein hrd7_25200 [Leptolinea sp. HRD-7]|nr:hypothetical protein hrd7_25200 [Leptolinea sp. HRD-7]
MTIKDYYPNRQLRDRMYADFGKDERRLCRQCALMTRNQKLFTSSRCAFVCGPSDFCWRGDWPACGLIDIANAEDERLKSFNKDGRRPSVLAGVKRQLSAGLLVADGKIIGSVEDLDTQPVGIKESNVE